MSEVYVVDAALTCALGSSLETVWAPLCRGESAIDLVRSFPTDQLVSHRAACMPGLQAGAAPNRVCALIARALSQLGPVPARTLVIWAGVKGNVEYLEAQAAGAPLPALYQPRQYRQWVCRQLGIEDGGMEVNVACASSTVGLALGTMMIDQGECTSVLICAADVVSRFTFTGFAALRALSASICRPFDTRRDGLCLGEGAAAMLLAGPAAITRMGRKPLARVTGWGISNDANHITGPAADGSGLATVIRQALDRAELPPERLEAWCAHGTGTVYNDAMELTVLEDVFGRRRFPVFSIKGAVGHTLGAAGVLEAALCTMALRKRAVPATASCEVPEPRAEGRVASAVQSFAGRNILTTNSGFGGVNAALILEAVGADLSANAESSEGVP